MKIIAVNISKTIKDSKDPLNATRRAWKLKLESCLDCDFVIGVANGKIIEVYRFIDVCNDLIQKGRVAFCLQQATPIESFVIRFAFDVKKINIKNFVVKNIIETDIFNL
ncbi:MAG: hypothetical protein WC223_09250 [Bacteroidales bacterium]|jgi:hypothetical protein